MSFVTTKVCLSQQNFCHDKQILVATKLLSQQRFVANFCHNKHLFVVTKNNNKTFVMTKILLVAAPTSDS